jgi:hypothetical protein
MEVYDLEGRIDVGCDEDLLRRLRSARRADYGAFALSHDPGNEERPSLWVHIHGKVAYVYYFPDHTGGHAGFTSWGMTPEDCEQEVDFLLPGGGERIRPALEALVPLDVAEKAAVDFLHDPALPRSVSWLEL